MQPHANLLLDMRWLPRIM